LFSLRKRWFSRIICALSTERAIPLDGESTRRDLAASGCAGDAPARSAAPGAPGLPYAPAAARVAEGGRGGGESCTWATVPVRALDTG
jgi:hypothetical protein